tara:strand:- start:770 stop:1435 length:666 start_codon:yes stop_codon:yes gene_type:complete
MSTESAEITTNRVLQKDTTYQLIKHEILTGKLSESTLLSERSLTKRFSTGKASVRDAIARLCSQGYLSIVPQRGVFVSHFSIKDMTDVFELRALIEPSIVSGLAGKIDDRLRVELAETLENQEKYARVQDVENFILQDLQFHMQLSRAYANREITRVMEHNCELVLRSLYPILSRKLECLKLAYNDHRLIFQALCDGKQEEAVSRTIRHIKSTKSLISNLS